MSAPATEGFQQHLFFCKCCCAPLTSLLAPWCSYDIAIWSVGRPAVWSASVSSCADSLPHPLCGVVGLSMLDLPQMASKPQCRCITLECWFLCQLCQHALLYSRLQCGSCVAVPSWCPACCLLVVNGDALVRGMSRRFLWLCMLPC